MKFKSKDSGDIYEFTLPHEIDAMQDHEGYEVAEEETEDQEQEKRKYIRKVK